MKLPFTKMHALGNDFVVIDDRDLKLKKLAQLSQKLCDRRFGIGADQLIMLCPSKKADFGMRIFNPDGTEAEMCGNGIRCLGKYIWDIILRCDESHFARQYSQTIESIAVETPAGIINIHKTRNLFRVDMGEPILDPGQIPVKISQKLKGGRGKQPSILKTETVINTPLQVEDRKFRITCVSMGNPHAVIFVNNVGSINLEKYGRLIENHALFPKKTNVEFIQIHDRNTIEMRVWERGAGETLACGTGASASVVASVLLGLTERKVTVHLPGGQLLIHWSEKDNHVYMTGPAETVFFGRIDI